MWLCTEAKKLICWKIYGPDCTSHKILNTILQLCYIGFLLDTYVLNSILQIEFKMSDSVALLQFTQR